MTRLATARSIPAAGLAGLAALLFIPLFGLGRLGPLDFWWGLSSSILLLAALAVFFDQDLRKAIRSDIRTATAKKIILGLASAAALYLLFALGGELARIVFSSAGTAIRRVYAFKAGFSSGRIFLLMLLVIGPGEEIFWRGFLQSRWQAGLGGSKGWLAASALYAAVHAGSGNFILVLAAAAGGLFWGWLFSRYRSIFLNTTSHIIWDVAIFLIRPLA
jgi:membrane protease YdiL (CAAX protease family)